MDNVDLLGPEIALMATAAVVVLLDVVLREKRMLGWLALAGPAASAIWTLTLVLRDRQGPAFDAAFSVDEFSTFFRFLFAGIVAAVILASMEYVRRFERFQGEYFALLLVSAAGLMLLAGSRDLIAIFVALELTAICQYVLAAFLRDGRSTEAGLKYILLGATSSAIVLYGMAFLFGLAGTTKLSGPEGEPSIAAVVAGADSGLRAGLVLAMVFLAVGFAFKMAVVPFQMWVPDIYQGAPTPVAAYLSVGSKAAAFAVVLRVFYEGLGGDFLRDDWSMMFAVMAAVSMTLGNVIALLQTDIKRLLGYSSIAQAGNFMVGLAAVSAADNPTLGASGVLFFLAAYAFTNLGAFITVVIISHRINSDAIADYAGMWRRAPLLALALGFCLVSLTGLPPTAGFMAKVYIFNTAVQSDLVWLVVIATLNTALAAFYYLRVVGTMFLAPPVDERPVGWTWPEGFSLAAAVAGVAIIGLIPTPLISAGEKAVEIFK